MTCLWSRSEREGCSDDLRNQGADVRHGWHDPRLVSADWTAIVNDYRRRSLQAMVGQVSPLFNIDDVHRDMLAAVIQEHGLATFTEEDRDAIHRVWHELDAWPDVAGALARLRARYAVVSFTILSTSLLLDVS